MSTGARVERKRLGVIGWGFVFLHLFFGVKAVHGRLVPAYYYSDDPRSVSSGQTAYDIAIDFRFESYKKNIYILTSSLRSISTRTGAQVPKRVSFQFQYKNFF